jgi:hypothetical protein
MADRHTDKISGGLADKSKPGDFDSKQLAMGVKVEMEHTSDRHVAMEIAMDHLKEDPRYYTKLKKVHKENRMQSHQMLSVLEEVRDSLEEMTSVKATGKTSGYTPGVSDPKDKPKHFKRFPEKTVAATKARGAQQRMMRDTEVKSTTPASPSPMPAKKKRGLISRAVARVRGSTNESMFIETSDIRSLLE